MIIAVALDELPTTLIGLVGLAAALIISDWVKSRSRNRQEGSKIGELQSQTQYLKELRDGASYDRKKSKKLRRLMKSMAVQVSEIHTKTTKKGINPHENQ